MEISKLNKEYRWGLIVRKNIRIFCRSYGKGILFRLRRKIVVFLSTIIDEKHQEKSPNSYHYKYWKTYGNKNELGVEYGDNKAEESS